MNEYSLTFSKFLIYLFAMATVTYLLRLIPMLFVRKKITNRFIRSVLYYVPYSVLAVMTFPAIFFVAPHVITCVIAALVAIALAYIGKSLIIVATGSALTVFICELIFTLL